jgi:hypothetical protein
MYFKGKIGLACTYMTVYCIAGQFTDNCTDFVGIKTIGEDLKCLGGIANPKFASSAYIGQDYLINCYVKLHLCVLSVLTTCHYYAIGHRDCQLVQR